MQPESSLLFPPFCLDLGNERLWRGSQAIPLRPKTFAVLRYLVTHPGRLVTKEALLDAVWPGTYVGDTLPKDSIVEIRRALGDDPKVPLFIETVHRRGYRFIAVVQSPKSQVQSQKEARGWKREASPPPSPQVSSLKSQASSLVGREAELAQLHRWLEKALQGERQIVFVTGEPGIGKTTIVAAFLEQVAADGELWIGRGQCIEHYGAGEAYMPMLEALGRLCREPEAKRLITVLRRYAPVWLMQMPVLLDTLV